MQQITVSVSDEVHRAVAARAAERGISPSLLVAEMLATLADEHVRLESQQRHAQGEMGRFRAADRLGRNALRARRGPGRDADR